MMGKQASAAASRQGIGWPQAFRDIVVASINKGQLPILLAGAVILVFVYRLPEPALQRLAIEMVDGLKAGYLLGYSLFGITLLGWVWYAQRARAALSKLAK